MTMMLLWCAPNMALACPYSQSHITPHKSWPRWWPLTSGHVLLAGLIQPASRNLQPSPPPPHLRAPALNSTISHPHPSQNASLRARPSNSRARSPRSRTSLSFRRLPGATSHPTSTRPAAAPPPQPRRPPARLTPPFLQLTAWHQRSRWAAAQAQPLSSTPKCRRGLALPCRRMAVPRHWLSASNKNHKSWTRCTLMMVRLFLLLQDFKYF